MRRQSIHVAAEACPRPAREPALDGVGGETQSEGLTAVEHAVLTSGEALKRPIQRSGRHGQSLLTGCDTPTIRLSSTENVDVDRIVGVYRATKYLALG